MSYHYRNSNIKPFLQYVRGELDRTYLRIDDGEFPPMRENSFAQRLSLLVEELGEIAELVKVCEGRKSKHPASRLPSEAVEAFVQEELVQLCAIAVDWATCDFDSPKSPHLVVA